MAIGETVNTSPPNLRQGGYNPRWPIIVWTLQLTVPLLIFTFGWLRLVNGQPVSLLVWTVLLGGTIWTVVIFAVVLHPLARRWLRHIRFKLLLVMVSSAGSFLVFGELLVRAASTQDVDGNIVFRGYHLQPYRLPVRQLRSVVEAYLRSDSTSHVFDPQLGWKPRPLYGSELFVHNSDSIRVERPEWEYAPQPPAETYRICIFGDSFVYGDEVRYEDTWGHILETSLNSFGARTEVLNFGVRAYGMDQAYLRWRQTGAKYSPRMVVFGLQTENIRRNANLIRPLYQGLHSGFPFSKPRFIPDNGNLVLINSPSMSPAAVLETLENIDDWALLEYEDFYDPRHYQPRIWHASKLASAMVYLLADDALLDRSERQLRERMTRLSLDIIDLFRRSVISSGAAFVIVYLPRKDELTQTDSMDNAQYKSFVQTVCGKFKVIDTSERMREAAGNHGVEALFAEIGHYSALGNRVVAEALSSELTRCINPHQPGHRSNQPAKRPADIQK